MRVHKTIVDVQHAIQSGSTSLASIVDDYIEEIQKKSQLNAFLEVFEDDARAHALIIDEKIKAGSAGKLAGCVIGIKDNICYKDHKVSASSKILKGFES
ncbi:MAG: Asp-tRNA(Asn)/Glu-tRNA(Gln) amidotransferase subunit GatA, partial [Flavobacteriales bacterium]|nr:Asp-tRNA(Asn)/Glu-tRNA(Gln) amidotransferase subunit GatA [Flavobacteriales bacterium]